MRRINRVNASICFLMLLPFWAGCSDEEKAIVPAPEISGIEGQYTILEGSELELSPIIVNGDQAVYRWVLDDKEVANTLKYTFIADQPGEHKLVLKVTNDGGTAQKEVSITVIARGSPPAISGLEEEYSLEAGEELTLTPTIISENEVTYAWFAGGRGGGEQRCLHLYHLDTGKI